MPRTEGEIVIDRPPDQVFDYVADERNIYDPRTVRAEKLSAGPIGVGTRFRTESRALGRAVPVVVEITAYDRARRLASSASLSMMEIETTLSFDPVGSGTRMRWLSDIKHSGLGRPPPSG